MEIIFAPKAINDLKAWKASGNNTIKLKISDLLTSIQQNPFTGIGKPEPLKHEFTGCWSRRINKEHRLIYEIKNGTIHII